MRYLISVIDTATASATPQEMAAIELFNERLQDEGWWVLAAGLASPSHSRVIDARGASPALTEGPLTQEPEYQSGLWIVSVPDDATAVALATDASRACHRRVELREFLGG
ncbi:YciI family protein [Demequina salsinemoris]|uniref:YciI family protein n=1 Tax=Demequina salsinemoris TaxID=577470 RepID=UPI000781A1A6|nr:YciI family protein [Demequina salsinemoris]